MKNVSMRIPEAGPLGETAFEASHLAMVAALFVNSPGGGAVDVVLTLAIHLWFRRFFGAVLRVVFFMGQMISFSGLDAFLRGAVLLAAAEPARN